MTTAITVPTEPEERKLYASFSGNIIEHLGIQMYQSPVAAIAETIANAWDADADNVEVIIPTIVSPATEIVISDDGNGMTFKECQERFLLIGYKRRGNRNTESTDKGRKVLGRKGIGKFAGFGIAQVVQVETVSRANGEKTIFAMDVEKLTSGEYVNQGQEEVEVIDYQRPDTNAIKRHGTKITLKNLMLKRNLNADSFARSMARRFAMHETATNFQVSVNGKPIPTSEDLNLIQFTFPQDYDKGEQPQNVQIKDGWGIETVGGQQVRWRVQFFKDTIDEEELRGISVFAGIKLAQTPFFFNLTGGLSGQHGQQYMTGQVIADFVDEQDKDIIAPERQRINWEHPATSDLLNWGQKLTRSLLGIWHNRRGEARRKQVEERTGIFDQKLSRLKARERRTVTQAINRIGSISTLSDDQFQELGGAILSAWDNRRLKGLIAEIADTERLTADELVKILAEADVLTALSAAEIVKTKLSAIKGLKDRIGKRELENAVRDYISEHPWLISPEWETFAVERSLKTIIDQAFKDSGMAAHKDFNRRIDLTLSSGNQILILEFMRPGLTINNDHLTRFMIYVNAISERLSVNSGAEFHHVTGYIIADRISEQPGISLTIQQMQNSAMFALDWDSLLAKAQRQWTEFLKILADRDPEDERLQSLLTSSDRQE